MFFYLLFCLILVISPTLNLSVLLLTSFVFYHFFAFAVLFLSTRHVVSFFMSTSILFLIIMLLCCSPYLFRRMRMKHNTNTEIICFSRLLHFSFLIVSFPSSCCLVSTFNGITITINEMNLLVKITVYRKTTGLESVQFSSILQTSLPIWKLPLIKKMQQNTASAEKRKPLSILRQPLRQLDRFK